MNVSRDTTRRGAIDTVAEHVRARKGRVWFVTALVVSAVATPATSDARPTSAPPVGLTAHGRLVWQFDALIHDVFGTRGACQGPRYKWNFTRTCSPASDFNLYEPTFVRARHSSFKLVSLPSNPVTANVLSITVNGRFVSCATGRWLVVYGSGIFPSGAFDEGPRVHRAVVLLRSVRWRRVNMNDFFTGARVENALFAQLEDKSSQPIENAACPNRDWPLETAFVAESPSQTAHTRTSPPPFEGNGNVSIDVP